MQKTGALVVDSKPSGANVWLNNKKLADTTPLRANNILPDDYQITVNKEGFYPWIKKLPIKTQETTFTEDITLFRASQPQKAVDLTINLIEFSPDRQYAAFTTTEFEQDFLYLFNLSSQKLKLLFNNKRKFIDPKIIWSPDNSKILFQNNGNTLVITTLGLKNIIDISILAQNLKLSDWRFDANDPNRLFALGARGIYQINAQSNEAQNIFSPAKYEILIDYYFSGNTLFIIKQFAGGNTILVKYDSFNSQAPSEFYKTLTLNSANSRFNNIYDNKLAIADRASNNFYLFNMDLDRLLFYKANVARVDYHQKKNYLLLQTGQELSYLDLSMDKIAEKNITRYSQGVDFAEWHKSPNYLAVQQNNKIHIIELDDRDSHFTITLPIDNIQQFSFDSKSNNIFFIKDNLLWQLELIK